MHNTCNLLLIVYEITSCIISSATKADAIMMLLSRRGIHIGTGRHHSYLNTSLLLYTDEDFVLDLTSLKVIARA